MKAVLLSIRPKWCELIASGKKTIEVRKTRPKIETPFKCYIYCPKGGTLLAHSVDEELYVVNGKVIGEFVCDHIEPLNAAFEPYGIYDVDDDYLTQTCVTHDDLWKYGNGKTLYGWYISDLKIYDEPKELGEFHHCGEGYHFNPAVTKPPQSWCYVEELQR